MDADVKDRIRRFIAEEVLFDEGRQVGDRDELLGDVLDSLALLQLVEYIEQQFGFEVDDAEMVPENFRTLDDLERYVRSRTS
ncbi:MAG: acyl carrier protein [Actinobacteria bacterium]|nr:acyl carrier protein [Actinomycetota bacterium]